MLKKLIDEHKTQTSEIKVAILDSDHGRVTELDSQIQVCFGKILNQSASNQTELRQQFLFLFSLLPQYEGTSETRDIIQERCIELFDLAIRSAESSS